jgi:hypothetical protein
MSGIRDLFCRISFGFLKAKFSIKDCGENPSQKIVTKSPPKENVRFFNCRLFINQFQFISSLYQNSCIFYIQFIPQISAMSINGSFSYK